MRFPINDELTAQWHPSKNGSLTPESDELRTAMKVWWQCNEGHEWQAYVYSRATGKGCSVCVWKTFSSKGEKEIQSLLDENKTNYASNTKALLKNRELDIFVQDRHLGIEFNGIYWHSEAGGKDEAYHMDKWRKCLEKDVDIFQVWEDDWNKNKESIQNKILSLITELSCDEKFAIKEITEKEYLKINKLDILAEHYLGVHIGDEPSSAIALNVKGDSIEIVGYVSNYARNTSFKYLVDYIATKFGSKSIHMLSDNCAGESVMLRENGFTVTKEYTPKCYRVRNGLRYHENDDKVKPVKGKTYPRLWDAGKTLWSKTLK